MGKKSERHPKNKNSKIQIIIHKSFHKNSEVGDENKQQNLEDIFHQETRQIPQNKKTTIETVLTKLCSKKMETKTNQYISKCKTTNSEEEVESRSYTAHKKNNGTKIGRMNSSRRPVSRLPNELAKREFIFFQTRLTVVHTRLKSTKKSKCAVCDNIKMSTIKQTTLCK